MVLFHRTTVAGARAIVKHGFRDDRWTFDIRDIRTGEQVTSVGVWLTDRPLAPERGPGGDAMLEVTLGLSEETLSSFELEGIFADARLWIVPAEIVTPHAKVRILAVDPGISGSFGALDGDPI